MRTDHRRPKCIILCLLLLAPGAAAHPPGDPSALGPFSVGHTQIAVTRRGTPDASERRLDPAVWYPADVHGEPEGPFGYVDPAVRRGRHPLLVYSHGGCAFPEVSSFLTMSLASWGFIVVAPSHPGDTVYDGFDRCDLAELRSVTLRERVDDVRAVLDVLAREGASPTSRFYRHLARSRIGVLGWSSGASTVLVVGHEDARIRGTLALAPDVRPERIGSGPFSGPSMVIEGDLDFYDPTQTALEQIYQRLRPPRFAVQLRRTGHFAFSDACFAAVIGGDDCRTGSLSQDEAHRVVLRFAVPFLLRYVAGDRAWARLLRPKAATGLEVDLRVEFRSPATRR